MKGIPKATPDTELAAAIKLQQETVLIEKALLNEQLTIAAGEIIKDKIKSVLSPANVLSNLAGAVSGMIAGSLVKKVVAGPQAGALRKVVGFFLQIATTKGISNVITTLIKNKESKM